MGSSLRRRLLALALASTLSLGLVACEEGGGEEEDVPGGNVEEEVQDEDQEDD
jgi:hypothetical protein